MTRVGGEMSKFSLPFPNARSSWWPVSLQRSHRLRQRILLDRWILKKTNLQPFHIRITVIIINALVRHLDDLAYNPLFSGEPSRHSDVQVDLRIRLGHSIVVTVPDHYRDRPRGLVTRSKDSDITLSTKCCHTGSSRRSTARCCSFSVIHRLFYRTCEECPGLACRLHSLPKRGSRRSMDDSRIQKLRQAINRHNHYMATMAGRSPYQVHAACRLVEEPFAKSIFRGKATGR